MKFRIGVLDDETAKATLILSKLTKGFEQDELLQRYKDHSFEPIEFTVERHIDDTILKIVENNLDGIIVDYKLSSLKTAAYSGVEVAESLVQYNEQFPIFILTAFEEDLYKNKVFSAYQVFDYDRYLSEPKESDELHSKIIQQIITVKKKLKAWEKELFELLPEKGKTAEIDSRIIELDSKLERSIAAVDALPEKTKHDLNQSSLCELLKQIDELLKEG